MAPTRQLHLGLFTYPGGHHIAGWRHPTVPADGLAGFEYYRNMIQHAERGKFDLYFVGDTLHTREKLGRFFGRQCISNPDPVSLVATLSSVTENIGLVATLSTTYHEPYMIAEKFATLDLLTGGRAGWNIVTTWMDHASRNFSRDQSLEKADRYVRGNGFMEACTALWDSWDDDALLLDQAGGRFCDPARIHAVDHASEYFSVRGPLRMPRCPQGWPVLVQAGGSPPGRNFAARFGEAIFTAQTRLPDAQAFRRSTHELMAKFGRRPEEVAIMPGLSPLIAPTEAEANRLMEELTDYVHPETGIWMLSENLNFPLYDYDPGGKLPVADIRAALGVRTTTTIENILGTAERDDLSITDLARRVARSRQHHSFVGTPEQAADLMQAWLEEGACDGFNIMPPIFHEQLRIFVDEVVPVLQRRGLFRRDYEGTTLRDHLGLARPSGRLGSGREMAAAQ